MHTVSGDCPPCLKPNSSYRSWRLRSCSLEWGVAVPILKTNRWIKCARLLDSTDNCRVCDRIRSQTSVSLLELFQGSSENAFDTSAIEDDNGIKNEDQWRGFRQNITKHVAQKHNGQVHAVWKLSRLWKIDWRFACSINAPACNTEAI